jgi:hypothetical protein
LRVTVSIADAGPNEGAIDTQPVEDATIQLGQDQTHTNSAGIVVIKVTRGQTASITAGDTLVPTSIYLRPIVKGCPKATGKLAGDRLGLIKLSKPFHIGLNTWYLTPNGSSTGVLKTRHGIVQEIGIADKQLTTNRQLQRAFVSSFS